MSEQSEQEIEVEPEYEIKRFWLVVATQGNSEPRVLKTEPRLSANELALRLEIAVPKRQYRIAQTIRIKLPDDVAHLAQIDVAVPEVVRET